MNVRERQCLLTVLKRSSGGSYYTGAVDGISGPLTRAAILAFQQDYPGLTATGEADETTDKAMRHAICYGMPVIDVENKTGTFWDEIEFFTEEEFDCKCGGRYCNGRPAKMREEVVRICDAARRHFGNPGHVISGLRCDQHNINEGGVWNSQHKYGEACDLQIEGVSADQLLAFILEQPGVRYAYKINGTNVHFDIPKGNR
jgi:peptidoglycan hydrolase-like protein with peptidoglycan-binding domain